MQVEHILTGRLAVREPDVHSLATQLRSPQRVSELHRDKKEMSSDLLIELGERGRMHAWNDQDMSRIHGCDVHHPDGFVVLVSEASRLVARHDRAEDAVRRAQPTTRLTSFCGTTIAWRTSLPSR